MGKNQQHKALQRAKHGGGDDDPANGTGDGTVDVTFHSPAWHAMRIAALTTERMSWEDWKKKQKEDEARMALLAGDEEAAMREYRAQLDADRAKKLSRGINHAELREKVKHGKVKKHKKSKKGKEKEKDKRKKKSKDKDREKKNSVKKLKKSKQSNSEGSSSSSGDSDTNESEGEQVVRLSDYMRSG